ncbi:hypothetical protein M8J75_010814 [Diaphorina citri]|nr:hypothetical protein M8J75_010814 [Diaphorina citri]
MNFDYGGYTILLILILSSFGPKLISAKSNKLDGGIINLLKINLEILLVRLFQLTQKEEVKELEKMNQLLYYYYKYNKTHNISDAYNVTDVEDFQIFTGKPSVFSVTEINKYLAHNRAVKYKVAWKRIRRKNHSAAVRDQLKSCLRKLPHVNRTLGERVLDEIDAVTKRTSVGLVTWTYEATTRRPTRRRTAIKTYLRYVSYQRLPTKNKTKTTLHMCEFC